MTNTQTREAALASLLEEATMIIEQVVASKPEWDIPYGDFARKYRKRLAAYTPPAPDAELANPRSGGAAPDMAEALQKIVACTHNPNPTDRQRIDVAPGKHRHFQDAIHIARAALAKARGAP